MEHVLSLCFVYFLVVSFHVLPRTVALNVRCSTWIPVVGEQRPPSKNQRRIVDSQEC